MSVNFPTKYTNHVFLFLNIVLNLAVCSLPNHTCSSNKPRKAQNSKHAHPYHHSNCPSLHITQRRTASRARVIRQRRVWLRGIHPKCKLIVNCQVPCLGRSTDTACRIVNNEGICLGQKRGR